MKRPTFLLLLACVWIGFGVLSLIFAPERTLLTVSQFVAGLSFLALWLGERRPR